MERRRGRRERRINRGVKFQDFGRWSFDGIIFEIYKRNIKKKYYICG